MKEAHIGVLVALGVAAFLSAAPVAAHHSFSAEFDAERPVVVEGAVSKVEWTNPHIWVYVDVDADGGEVLHYQCEGTSPNALTRRGWHRDTLKVGDRVVIDGYEAKNDRFSCNMASIRLSDGTRLFAGSSIENEQ